MKRAQLRKPNQWSVPRAISTGGLLTLSLLGGGMVAVLLSVNWFMSLVRIDEGRSLDQIVSRNVEIKQLMAEHD